MMNRIILLSAGLWLVMGTWDQNYHYLATASAISLMGIFGVLQDMLEKMK